MKNGVLKWAAAAAASGILLVAVVPAIATVSHKKLSTLTHSSKPLMATATPVKAHKLSAQTLKHKKLVAKSKHVVSKLHATKAKIKAAPKHKAITLDKSSKLKSTM